ncbi:MAG TPA: hypothetical protein VFC78_01890 [Tepidisphaeraceae bacterium]|nr:hypothetical protein [Tepidisphaeraceae bacterium]
MKFFTTAILAGAMITGIYTTGCSHEVAKHETTTQSPDGATSTDTSKTTRNPVGSLTTTHEKNTNNP